MKPANFDWRRVGTIAVVVTLLVVSVIVLVSTVPQVAGADHSYVVLSDSMSPTISAGSVVFVAETAPDGIEVDDVITYARSEDTRITHRVVDVETVDGHPQFRTKGDANDDPDPGLVAASDVIGVVRFHVPLIGYLIKFGGSTMGLVTLVIVPGVLLALSEVWSLYATAAETEEE